MFKLTGGPLNSLALDAAEFAQRADLVLPLELIGRPETTLADNPPPPKQDWLRDWRTFISPISGLCYSPTGHQVACAGQIWHQRSNIQHSEWLQIS